MLREAPTEFALTLNSDERGLLAFANLPFAVKRFYSISNNLHDLPRGNHAHKVLRQAIFCAQGSFRLLLNTPEKNFAYTLTAWSGLVIIPAGYWRVLDEFTKDSICVVLASDEFNEFDYIRDYKEYEKWFWESTNES